VIKIRLGFPVRVLGCPDLPSYDARHWSQRPHLSLSLAYLRDILHYLQANRVHMYRMHSSLAPYVTCSELTRPQSQIDECRPELGAIGDMARDYDVRLSFHPHNAIVLNALNEDQALRSAGHLEALTQVMDAMNLGPEAVIVVHVGGVYDDIVSSRERFVRRYERLSEAVRRRLALENDDRRFSHADVRLIHQACGVRLVFDNLHHLVLNPEQVSTAEALDYSLNTWPEGTKPKVHFSTPRADVRTLPSSHRLKVPTWTEHSDFVNPFEFIAFSRMAQGMRPFDVMLEAKARDLALLKLRDDLRRFAPDLADRIN